MSSADSCDAEVIALDDTADIDEVVNESESDPVIAVKKRYISEADFEYVAVIADGSRSEAAEP